MQFLKYVIILTFMFRTNFHDTNVVCEIGIVYIIKTALKTLYFLRNPSALNFLFIVRYMEKSQTESRHFFFNEKQNFNYENY